MQVSEQEFVFGDKKLVIFSEEDDPESLTPSKSTGLIVWPAAQLLCKYLYHEYRKNQNFFKGKSMIELGAGLGLCGLICSSFGAKFTVVTDKSSEVLQLLRTNIKRNFGHTDKVVCHKLQWGVDLDKRLEEMECESFDLILGSDLVYNDVSLNPLCETVSKLISKRGKQCEFWLTYVSRDIHLDTKFSQCIKSHMLQLDEIPLSYFLQADEPIPCNEYVPAESLKLYRITSL